MAKLIVTQNKKMLHELVLKKGKTYTVGRSSENDLVLDEANLSRQHFKITFENDAWTVSQVARFGEIIFKDKAQKTFSLANNDTFKISIFTFKFSENDESLTQMPTQDLPADPDEKTFSGDHTSVASSYGVPFIKIVYPDKHIDTLRMEGEYWVIGRDTKNEVFIDDPKSSRTHAEIAKHGDFFTLRDLKSSNGTYFNGNKMQPNVPTAMLSGDTFSIGNTHFTFEIRDPNFETNLSTVTQDNNQFATSNLPGAVRIEDVPIYMKRPAQIGGAVVALLVLFMILPSGDPKPHKGRSSLASKSEHAKQDDIKLSPEQNEFVDKTYKLAKTLYMSQKYELALSEIQKVHELLPIYQDSKEIEALCREAIDLKMQQKKIEIDEQHQEQVTQQIHTIIDKCDEEFRTQPQPPDHVRDCLSSALELDPGNADAQALITKAEEFQQVRELKQQNQIAYQNNVMAAKGIYQKAKQLEHQGKLLEALQTFKRHIASALPDPENLKTKSQSEVLQVSQELNSKVSTYKAEASQLKSQEKLKEAIAKLNKAGDLDPTSEDIKHLQHEYSLELFKNMKNLYADSVLEENLGNIEAAKEKWKKIRELDVPRGEYQEKARSKLKRYGLE